MQGRTRASRAREGDDEAPRRGARSDGMTLPGLRLSRADLGTIVAVLNEPTDSFLSLAKLAGLDPARDFRGADLRGVDSGTDLTGADLSRASGLDRIVFDAATRWPASFRRPPPDFDIKEARRMILRGEAPPEDWRPFIT